MVEELAVAFALILVIEGVIYSLFPNAMKRMLEHLRTVSPQALRVGGLIFAAIGVFLVWLLRG